MLLINDVLDFNKFDSDKVDLERIPFDLSALIQNNYSSMKLKAEEKSLDVLLVMDEELKGVIVNSDPTRLSQVLSNLMNNAIKFTEEGTVSLCVQTLERSIDKIKVRFIIQDTGIGIKPDRQEGIFEPYVQASSSTTRNYGGTGLGLGIVKKILTMFNSCVEMESAPNIGTKISFDIDFDYQQLDVLTVTNGLEVRTDLGHLKVLVAEDHEVNILVIKKTLEKWNIVPEIAKNGLIALQKLEQENFDLILMDLYMPIMDGFEAAASIRNLKDVTKSEIPIIALTAKFNEKVAQEVLHAKMNDYLSKPFNPDHLFAKLKAIADKKADISSCSRVLALQNLD